MSDEDTRTDALDELDDAAASWRQAARAEQVRRRRRDRAIRLAARAGVTQTRIADVSGVERSAVSRIIRGERGRS